MLSPTRHNQPRTNARVHLLAHLLTATGILAGSAALFQITAPKPVSRTNTLISHVMWAQPEPEPVTQEGMRECVITLRSGRTITGELVFESSREVVIGINGINTRILPSKIVMRLCHQFMPDSIMLAASI